MWSILLVDIRLVWILKLHILTFNFVLCNSKWGHSPICQYCFKATSATPSVPLQFKGELRERWVQLAEISQNKLSYKYCTMLKHHSSFADRGMTLSCDPCTPARCIKTPGWRITFSLTHRWSKTETLLEKKKKRLQEPILSASAHIKGKPSFNNQKEGFHLSKTIRGFQRGTTADIQLQKTYSVFGCLIPFLSLLWMWILRVIDHLIKFSPKESDPFHTAQEFRRETPLPPFRHTQTRLRHETSPNDCPSKTRGSAIKW